MSKSLDFLKEVFLGDGAKIISARGAEEGLSHLEIVTQTKEQAENNLKSVFRVHVSEEDINTEVIDPLTSLNQKIEKLDDGLVAVLDVLDRKCLPTSLQLTMIRRAVEKSRDTPVEFLRWEHPEFSDGPLYTELATSRAEVGRDYLGKTDSETLAQFEVSTATMTWTEFENLREFTG